MTTPNLNTSDDKFTLDYSKRRHSKTEKPETSRDEMVMKNYSGELDKALKNLVGPAFIGCGFLGFLTGIAQSAKNVTFKNRPKKLIFTSVLNTVGKQTSRFSNIGAALALMYCLDRKIINFLFDEDLQGMSAIQKQAIYGFSTGFIFKFFTKGLASGALAGTLMAGLCVGATLIMDKAKH